MERRDFVRGIGAAGTPGQPGVGHRRSANPPAVNWRLASSFPKSLDTIYGGARAVCPHC